MKFEKVEKLFFNLRDKTEFVRHIRNLKQALNHRLVLKKVNRKIKFNHINTDQTKKRKMIFKLINNAVFGKTMENMTYCRYCRDIKHVPTERRRNCLVSEPSYHTTMLFTENLFAIEMKRTEILLNKHV